VVRATVIAISAIAWLGTAQAAESPVVLFDDDGKRVANYAQLIAPGSPHTLGHGRHVLFENGESFRIIAPIVTDPDATTAIYLAEADGVVPRRQVALRIPGSPPTVNRRPTEDFIDEYLDGQSKLKHYGLAKHTPEIVSSHRRQYIAVDYLPHRFNAEQFLFEAHDIDPDALRDATRAWTDFFEHAALFEKIGAFRLDQMVYAPKYERWMLLDWTAAHRLWNPASEARETFFDATRLESQARARAQVRRKALKEPWATWIDERLDDAIRAIRQARKTKMLFVNGCGAENRSIHRLFGLKAEPRD